MVERLQDVGGGRIPIGTAGTPEELHVLLEDRGGTYMIHCGDRKVRWEFDEVVYDGPHREEYREYFRVQLGEIVKALSGWPETRKDD